MQLFLRILIGLFALIVIAVIGLYATGRGNMISIVVAAVFYSPDLPFEAADAVEPPDYSDLASWAALPFSKDLADMRPSGIGDPDIQGSAPVDTFFIHPTGFMKGSSWTFSMDPNTVTEENTKWMLANQASAYNGCCNVYAPRYRQASIYAYLADAAVTEEVLAFAYQDVERAFEYFLENYSYGRPFVIASHSQGTSHAARLLKNKIDNTPLAKRLVAAYTIGGGLKHAQFAAMQDITLCDSASSTGCAVHWDTYSEAVIDEDLSGREDNICVNPLSWEVGGGRAGKEMHVGAVPMSGDFGVEIRGDDTARGTQFESLKSPLPNYVEAECKDGILFITDQSETVFNLGSGFGRGNYHGLDYPIFHMDIRENVKLRVATYLQQNSAQAAPPTGDFLDGLRDTD